MSDTLAPPTPAAFVRSAVSEITTIGTAGDGRTVEIRLVPWDRPQQVRDRGRRTPYEESFARGGLTGDPAAGPGIIVEREHDGETVGVIDTLEDRPDGLYGTVKLTRGRAGADMLADIKDRIYRYVSVDFLDAPVPATARAVQRTAARLRRVAFTLDPAHDAPIVSVRSTPPAEPGTEPNGDDMPELIIPPAPVTTQTLEQTVEAAEPVVTTRARPTLEQTRELIAAGQPRFETFGHFVRSVANGEIEAEELDRFQRALADVVTTDVTGLIREGWIDEVIDLRRTYAPTVEHWRKRPLPAKGMSFSQPVLTTRPTIGKQATQKSEITSTDAVIGIESWPIDTYGGGNDVSIQALTRAEPDLLNELMRLYTKEMAHGINAAAVTALNAAAAVGVSGNAALEYTTPEAFVDLVIDACVVFMRATKYRRPADQIALSVDLWAALGKAKDLDERPLYPALNPMNTHGTLVAPNDNGQLITIPWYVEPDLGTGIKGVIGISDAFVTALGPVGTLTADVPSKLGRDVAVYQEAAFGAAEAGGLVQIVNAV